MALCLALCLEITIHIDCDDVIVELLTVLIEWLIMRFTAG